MTNGFTPIQCGPLAGIDQATLQQWLSDAQQSLALLMTGRRLVSGSYNGKSVSYSQSDVGTLMAWIQMLQYALGIGCKRRAIVPYYR
jgi:hypothetical protein